MTDRLLNVSAMPFERIYTCQDDTQINMSEFLRDHADAVEALVAHGLVRDNEDSSFGFAMAEPSIKWSHILSNWDDPEKFVWFVGGWGPERDRFIANAIRKMRAMLRIINESRLMEEDFSTLRVRFWNQKAFKDIVPDKNEDGTFPWGDFPWGGAVLQHMGRLKLMGAVSCLTEIEDDFMAKLLLGGVGQKIVIGNRLLPAA